MQSHRRARPRTRRASSLQDASLLGLGTSPLLPAAEEKQGHGRSPSAAACASSSYLTPPLTLRAFVLPLVVPFPRAVYQSPLGRVARVTERPRPSVPRAHRSRRQQRASPSAALGAPCALRPRLLLVHHGPAPTPLLVVWPGPGQEPRSCPPPFFPPPSLSLASSALLGARAASQTLLPSSSRPRPPVGLASRLRAHRALPAARRCPARRSPFARPPA